MPVAKPIPIALMRAPFRLADAESMGVTRTQLRGRRYETPMRGVHAAAGQLQALVDLCLAGSIVLPKAAAFSDETAVALLGLPVPGPPSPPLHVTVPEGSAAVRRKRIVGHVRDIDEADVIDVDGVRVTSAARTLLDLAARYRRRTLVGIADAALRSGRMSVADLVSVLDRHPGRRGIIRLRNLIDVLDPGAESPRESWLRLLLVDAGLPRPETNVNVYDALGRFIGRVDLLFRKQRVIAEYDGDQHRTDKAQFAHDVRRLSRLSAAGYVVLRFTAEDVARRPEYVIATVRNALSQAR